MIGLGVSIPYAASRKRGNPAASFDFDGPLPAGAALTRASAGSRIDATGALVSTAANAARFDYNGATLAYRGLLVEPAATNFALASETFDTAPWSTAGATVAANAAASPAGTATADKLVETAANSQHRVMQVVATTIGQLTSLSLFVKAAERSTIWLRLFAATPYANGVFDLAAGTISGVTGSATITPLVNGWYRITISGLADGASTTAYANLLDGAATAYLGIVGSGMLLWGAQIEAGAPSSYIATTGAAAPRSADVLTLDWSSRNVPNGTPTVRYTFDDGSTQDVTTAIVAGAATVPTSLNRSRLRRAAVV